MDIQVTYHYICTAPLPIPLFFHQPSGTEDIWAASSLSSADGGGGGMLVCVSVLLCFCMHMSLYLWVCMPACDSVCVFGLCEYILYCFLTYKLFHCFWWTPVNDVNWQSVISWYNEPIIVFFMCLFVCFILRQSASAQNDFCFTDS